MPTTDDQNKYDEWQRNIVADTERRQRTRETLILIFFGLLFIVACNANWIVDWMMR